MKTTNKNGIQLSNAFGAVLAVVLIAVLVIIALFLFETIGDGFTLKSATTLNEEDAFINNSVGPDGEYIVVNADACNGEAFTLTRVINASGTVIQAGNYSMDSATGTITNLTIATWDDLTINYTYNWGGDACSASQVMVTQFATYPALVGLVGTIIFLGIVIGVLVASFVFGGKRQV